MYTIFFFGKIGFFPSFFRIFSKKLRSFFVSFLVFFSKVPVFFSEISEKKSINLADKNLPPDEVTARQEGDFLMHHPQNLQISQIFIKCVGVSV